MTRNRRNLTTVLTGILAIVCLGVWEHSAAAQDQRRVKLATKMLESVGSQKGLCVLLGPEDAGLAVALCRDGQYLVHGLCTSLDAVNRVRQGIEQADLRGAVSVETGSVKQLPY